VRGNHEDMMIDWSVNKNYLDSLWLLNGGQKTIDSPVNTIFVPSGIFLINFSNVL
jgi:hypothetical protein